MKLAHVLKKAIAAATLLAPETAQKIRDWHERERPKYQPKQRTK